MTESTPVPIGAAEIARFKEPVEALLTDFYFKGEKRSLPDLLRQIDPNERHIMGDLERDAYLALREGLQIFRAVADLLGEKAGLKKQLLATPPSQITTDPRLKQVFAFTNGFAVFASALYVTRKLSLLLQREGADGAPETLHDLSTLRLDLDAVETTVLKLLVLPVFDVVQRQAELPEKPFRSPVGVVDFIRQVFSEYARIAAERRRPAPELDRHLQGYTFRIMDDFLELAGYEDRTLPSAAEAEARPAFTPIRPEEIVGNQWAKREIWRFVERLALYDAQEQRNPVLETGGLAWSVLFDGPPGTGKTMLFRMAMTRLDELSDAVGTPYHVVSIDQSIKDEYYGKTGKILLSRLESVKEPHKLAIVLFDDIDLLTSTRRDAQGGDNDINNIVMQYLDGAFTVRRGHAINFAASNKPTGLDEALRNRFSKRMLIDGPQTAEDWADLLQILARPLLSAGLLKMDTGLGYQPFATQWSLGDAGGPSGSEGEKLAGYLAERLADRGAATIHDFGRFMAEVRLENDRITGRSAKAIFDAVKDRAADFDVPPSWFESRAEFLDQPYERKVSLVHSLYQPITPQLLFEEAMRYVDSERRYAETEADEDVAHRYASIVRGMRAQVRALTEVLGDQESVDLPRLLALESDLEALRQLALEERLARRRGEARRDPGPG